MLALKFTVSLRLANIVRQIIMRLVHKHLVLLLLILPWSLGARAQERADEIDQIFQKFYEYTAFQGAVLVADRGEVVYQRAFGQANREWSVPNTLDTRFNIASLSKQFTAVLILRLVDAGRLDLERPISDYLPEYRADIGQRGHTAPSAHAPVGHSQLH